MSKTDPLDRLSARGLEPLQPFGTSNAVGMPWRPLREGHHWTVEDRGYETPCWVWTGYLLKGYAMHGRGRAYRIVWRQFGRTITPEYDLHHKCEQPACVNPDHLEPKTRSQHLADHKQEASSLCWDDVRAIRAAFKAGAAQRDLGKQYGIAQPTLSDIITNTTWKDPSYKPGRPAVCALEECGADFLAGRSNQRFCCSAHHRLWNSRRSNRRARGVPVDGPSKWKRAA